MEAQSEIDKGPNVFGSEYLPESHHIDTVIQEYSGYRIYWGEIQPNWDSAKFFTPCAS